MESDRLEFVEEDMVSIKYVTFEDKEFWFG